MLNALAETKAVGVTLKGTSTTARDLLYEKYKKRIVHNSALDRTLVSFQANKRAPFYSWFKYKEGFSQHLVSYLLKQLWHQPPGIMLDPFAGAGTALFAAWKEGWQTKGIEISPVGIFAMQARLIATRIDIASFEATANRLAGIDFTKYCDTNHTFNHIAITRDAFPQEEERQLTGYLGYCYEQVANTDERSLLLFAGFCILEEISYTRKDGQYLRWDYRSGRTQGNKPFDKGSILPFREALLKKLSQMLNDLKGGNLQLKLFEEAIQPIQTGSDPNLQAGSCLELLPKMEANSVDFVLTSPPYANRYDYTRTYALELVYLGCNDVDVKRLRQSMLSCTVENKNKRDQLQQYYANLDRSADFTQIERTFEQQAALQEVLEVLEGYKSEGRLNNDHITRLVRNYFYETCFVVFELSRLIRQGGIVAMINDNVRYAGEEVPVDLILSDMAETFGLKTRTIWTLGRGKGNSSQQMGYHGRSELRKCVYVWEKS